MVKMEIAMAHALSPRQLAKDGVRGIFALFGTEALKQNPKFMQVQAKVYG
jgi:hypothetical protein